MKVNEFRVGNFIKFNNHLERERIVQIDLRFFASWAGGRSPNEMNINEELSNYYKPIELNHEILEKCGFELVEFNIPEYRLVVNRAWIMIIKGGIFNLHDYQDEYYSNNIQIKYLHQLQNLYFSLTGEELKIIF